MPLRWICTACNGGIQRSSSWYLHQPGCPVDQARRHFITHGPNSHYGAKYFRIRDKHLRKIVRSSVAGMTMTGGMEE